jgi:hypothetical protein
MKAVSTFVQQIPGRVPLCMIRMTVDTGSITTLRRVAMRICGEAMEFIRIARCAGALRTQVWLCVRRPVAATLCETVLRQLPGALLLASASYPGEAA